MAALAQRPTLPSATAPGQKPARKNRPMPERPDTHTISFDRWSVRSYQNCLAHRDPEHTASRCMPDARIYESRIAARAIVNAALLFILRLVTNSGLGKQ